MDLSWLPATVTDYNKQRTGAHFTGRSVHSRSYSNSCRLSTRRRGTAVGWERHGGIAVTNWAGTEEDTGRTVSHGSVKGQHEERDASGYKMTAKLRDAEEQTAPQCVSDRGKDPAFEDRGRTAWKRSTFSYRSKSLDWRTEKKSPDWRIRDLPSVSYRRGADISRQAPSLAERNTGFDGGVTGKASHTSQTLEKANWCNSLPSRGKSGFGLKTWVSEAGGSLGFRGGQSIHERIEKLYGSAGFGKADDLRKRNSSASETSTDALNSLRQKSYSQTAGGTFPRRFSEDFNAPVRRWMPSMWTQNDAAASGSQALALPSRGSVRERSLGSQWQGQAWSRYSDGGGVTWRKGFVDSGTRSLDRARSKNTVAAQIRAARAAADMSSSPQPNNVSAGTSASYRVSDRFRERRTSGSMIEGRTNFGEERSETYQSNGQLKEKIGRVRSREEEDGVQGKTTFRSLTIEEENPPRAGEKKKLPEKSAVASSASVRNKIDQFEALTQTGHGPEANQVPMPRRTFSVPAQLSRNYEGVKKSRSAKDIDGLRQRMEGLTEGSDAGGEEKRTRTGQRFRSERSLSVDVVGLRVEKKESGGHDVVDGGKSNPSDEFEKYSKLKKTLEIPLNERTGMTRKQFFIDETDFSKALSPEGENVENVRVPEKPSIQRSGGASAGNQERSSSDGSSPVTDDDKTPTNTPDHSPFFPPATQVEDATPRADCQNKRSFVFTQGSNSGDPDTPPLPGPLRSSPASGLTELVSSEVRKAPPRGRKQLLDLDAWITGLNPEFKGWSYEDDDDDDDDESTQRDDDSNYDSDSGESSVTVTSNMSQSDRRSFSVNLSDLCNFTGADSESDDSDEWQSSGRRSASLSSDVSALSYVSVMPAEELDRLMEDVKSLGNNPLQDNSDVQVVVLHKDVGVGLGFSLAGGVDQNKPITVHKVFHSGVAAKEGSIREGDQVLSINGSALQGTAHWEALRVLRRAKTREMGVVVLRRDEVTGPPRRGVQDKSQGATQPQYETGQRVCVQLQKNSRDLGFSLEGGVGSSEGNRPLTVQKVFLGGPTDQVCSGDEILEIQGRSVVAMRRLEVWTLIRALPSGPVDVVLRRPPKPPET